MRLSRPQSCVATWRFCSTGASSSVLRRAHKCKRALQTTSALSTLALNNVRADTIWRKAAAASIFFNPDAHAVCICTPLNAQSSTKCTIDEIVNAQVSCPRRHICAARLYMSRQMADVCKMSDSNMQRGKRPTPRICIGTACPLRGPAAKQPMQAGNPWRRMQLHCQTPSWQAHSVHNQARAQLVPTMRPRACSSCVPA